MGCLHRRRRRSRAPRSDDDRRRGDGRVLRRPDGRGRRRGRRGGRGGPASAGPGATDGVPRRSVHHPPLRGPPSGRRPRRVTVTPAPVPRILG
ncbi:hypothetical protein DC432_11590 [Microbacterium testaceum]|uniref:Uncharacterized protein n=1 Tax=Microbacterium testaceum TaxID=2033 RepID=A0A2T7WF94_MICTE|nr:hypothetical protein DC432_11590 [Microbacterium testaceum]